MYKMYKTVCIKHHLFHLIKTTKWDVMSLNHQIEKKKSDIAISGIKDVKHRKQKE